MRSEWRSRVRWRTIYADVMASVAASLLLLEQCCMHHDHHRCMIVAPSSLLLLLLVPRCCWLAIPPCAHTLDLDLDSPIGALCSCRLAPLLVLSRGAMLMIG